MAPKKAGAKGKAKAGPRSSVSGECASLKEPPGPTPLELLEKRVATLEKIVIEANLHENVKKLIEENTKQEQEIKMLLNAEGVTEVRAEIANIFKDADVNNDGYICREELPFLLHNPNEYNSTEIEDLFARFDSNGDGLMAYEEFIDWVKRSGKQETLKLFRSVDDQEERECVISTYPHILYKNSEKCYVAGSSPCSVGGPQCSKSVEVAGSYYDRWVCCEQHQQFKVCGGCMKDAHVKIKNSDGVPLKLGNGGHAYYCGRPDGDWICGPGRGHRCPLCRDYQKADASCDFRLPKEGYVVQTKEGLVKDEKFPGEENPWELREGELAEIYAVDKTDESKFRLTNPRKKTSGFISAAQFMYSDDCARYIRLHGHAGSGVAFRKLTTLAASSMY